MLQASCAPCFWGDLPVPETCWQRKTRRGSSAEAEASGHSSLCTSMNTEQQCGVQHWCGEVGICLPLLPAARPGGNDETSLSTDSVLSRERKWGSFPGTRWGQKGKALNKPRAGPEEVSDRNRAAHRAQPAHISSMCALTRPLSDSEPFNNPGSFTTVLQRGNWVKEEPSVCLQNPTGSGENSSALSSRNTGWCYG